MYYMSSFLRVWTCFVDFVLFTADFVDSFTEERALAQKLHDQQLVLYDLEEEKSAWLLLVRQALIDWDFLDNSLKRCYPSENKLRQANGDFPRESNPFDCDDEDLEGASGSQQQHGSTSSSTGAVTSGVAPCKLVIRNS